MTVEVSWNSFVTHIYKYIPCSESLLRAFQKKNDTPVKGTRLRRERTHARTRAHSSESILEYGLAGRGE